MSRPPPARAMRAPPSRRALFHPHPHPHNAPHLAPSSRRNTNAATTIRPDSSGIFEPPMEDELVERAPTGDYVVLKPGMGYRAFGGVGAVNAEVDEDIEHEAHVIELYGKQSAHWDDVVTEGEIKGALKSSLRRMVAGIDDDAWMFPVKGEVGEKK